MTAPSTESILDAMLMHHLLSGMDWTKRADYVTLCLASQQTSIQAIVTWLHELLESWVCSGDLHDSGLFHTWQSLWVSCY